MVKEEEKGRVLFNIVDHFTHNIIVYLLVILALAACIYTLSTTSAYADKCNAHYIDYIKSYCACSSMPYNFTEVIYLPILNVSFENG